MMLTRDEVLASRDSLPAFPRVIEEILATLDDPDANVNLLVAHIERDPVLAARVYALANAAGSRSRPDASVRDLYTAMSLIGFSRLRHTAIMTSLAGFLKGAMPPGVLPGFWLHSSSAGVCAQQLAAHAHQPADTALIAGLLHDVGQLWLLRFQPEAFVAAWKASMGPGEDICVAERHAFGVDHAVIGAWLAESWGLPDAVCEAIRYHHTPDEADAGVAEPLINVVHVAEVLSNALDTSGNEAARVTSLSEKACSALGLDWGESTDALFGRIDAMSQYASTFFRPPPQ